MTRLDRIVLSLFTLIGSAAFGATFNSQVLTTSPPPATGCVTPPSQTSFLTTEGNVYLYFVATVTASDSLINVWTAPDGSTFYGSWTPSAGTFCFTGAFVTIAGLAPSQLGAWTVQVSDNGILLFSIPFNVSAPPAITNNVVSTQAPPTSGCQTPPAVTSFYSSQGTVHLYFDAVVTSSDVLTNDWLAPNGVSVSPGGWSPIYSCYFSSLDISNLPSNQFGTWQARVFDDGVLLFSIPFTVSAGAPASGPTISLVANGADNVPAIAPNTWVEIKGTDLAAAGDIRTWRSSDFVNNQLPTNLDGVSATVNGKSAYVYYISPTQVNILTPPDALQGSVQVQLTNNGPSASLAVQGQAASPAFFMFNGGPYVIAQHVNGSLIGPTSLIPGQTTPAAPGETIVLYGTGFGASTNPVISGATTQSGSLVLTPTVQIGGINAQVIFAGLVSPGEVQMNVVVPQIANSGDVTLTANYNGGLTQSGLLLTVAAAASTGTAGIQIISGNSQSTPIHTAFPSPLVVEVTNAQGNPMSGAQVSWSITPGLGTLSSTSTQTGSNGQTSITVTAGGAVGTISVTATSGAYTVQFLLTANAGATSPLTVTSVSTPTPLPLNPLYIQTAGVNVNAPVTVNFSNSSGYSVSAGAIRVSSSGMVVAAVPIYADANAVTSSGSVSMTISQGSFVSAPIAITIQDLPSVQSYGTSLGQISRAFVEYEAMNIARRINELQAFQGLPGNTVDMSQEISNLQSMLLAVIESRSDLDRVTLNNSLVIAGGNLSSGTPIQFDKSSLDMMDRILGAYLVQMQPYLVAPPAGTALEKIYRGMPVLGISKRGPVRGGVVRVARGRKQGRPQASASGSMTSLIGFLTNAANGSGIAATYQSYATSDANFLDKISAVAGGFSGLFGLYAQNALSPTKAFPLNTVAAALGAISGGAAMLNDMGHELGALAFVITASDTTDPSVINMAWTEITDKNLHLVVDSIQTELSLFSYGVNSADLPLFSSALDTFGLQVAGWAQTSAEEGAINGSIQVVSLLTNLASYDLDMGFQTLSNLGTQLSNEASAGLINVENAFGELVGSVDVTTDLGIEAPLSGLLLDSDYSDTFNTLADPNGDYMMTVTIGDPDFDYSDGVLNLMDPVTQEPLGSVNLNLTNLSSQSAFSVSTVSGTCDDDDANDPDSDDPDCDAMRKSGGQPATKNPPARGKRAQLKSNKGLLNRL